MAIEIKSPTFPESVADGTVANWVKKEGDIVNSAEVIGEFDDTQEAQLQNEEKTETKEEVVLEKQDTSKASNKKSGPAAKKIIAENNIDPQSIESSRKDQRITKACLLYTSPSPRDRG